MVNNKQLDYLLQALTHNELSASEFQDHFVRFNHEERLFLLDRLDAVVYGPKVIQPSATAGYAAR